MIYFIILAVLALFAFLYDVLNLREGRSVIYWGAWLLLVCLAGFRFKVGGDTYNYMTIYKLLPNLQNILNNDVDIAKLQPLWFFFTAIAKSIGEDFYIFQFLHAIVVNAAVFFFIYKNTNYRHTAILIYYFTFFPFLNFELLRESLAVCCFLASIQCYVNKNWLKYYLIITVAFLFHFSAVFLYFLPFVRNFNPKPRNLILIFIIAALLSPLLHDPIDSLTEAQFIGQIVGRYAEYKYSFLGLISIFVFYLFTPLVFASIANKNIELHSNCLILARKWLIIGSIIPLLFIFYRFFNYFSIIFIIIVCEVGHSVIKNIRPKTSKFFMTITLFSLALIFGSGGFFKDTSDLIPSTRWYIRWYPYHSIFDPITVPERDQMVEMQTSGSR